MASGFAGIERHGAAARIISLQDPAPAAVAPILANTGPCALFWPGDGEPELAAEIDGLLAAIDCPVIVVR